MQSVSHMKKAAGKHQSRGLTLLNQEDFLVLASRRYVAFDLETTGLNAKTDRITEIGALRVEYGQVTQTFQMLVNPRRPIPREVVNLTHITNEMVRDAPGIEEVLPAFLAFLGDDVYVAHNASFDVGFLRENAAQLGLTLPEGCADSLEVARSVWPGLSTYRLGNVAQVIGYDMKVAHRSLADTEALCALVNRAVEHRFSEIRKHALYAPGWDLPQEKAEQAATCTSGRLAVLRATWEMERHAAELGYPQEVWVTIPARQVRQFPGVENLRDLAAVIRKCWSEGTIHDAVFDKEAPAFHQDDVTARLVRDMCGLETVCFETPEACHVLCRMDGTLLDLTGGLDGERAWSGEPLTPCEPCSSETDYARYRQLQRNLVALLN